VTSELPLDPGREERTRSTFVEPPLGRGPGAVPDVEPLARADSGPSSELLRRLTEHSRSHSRYRILDEIGRGGMGAVLRIWDEDLRRHSAMKVVLGRESEASSEASSEPAVDAITLGRFLEEAQVTGQLDHPGIVPVHELGLGHDGQVYFTMRLVKGDDLCVIYEHVRTGADGWNPTRALGVLLKVCEAMAYAHDKGVLHRDLKPANVMVGRYGEVYVMDWGLARVLGQADRHDLRLRSPAAPQTLVHTARTAERHDTPDSPLMTMDGVVMGTPAYMSPEQARGELEALGPHSDVYALGAMLYELLAGEMPFVPRGARVSPHMVLMRQLEGPPRPLAELAPRTPPELVAIAEKAMAREPAQRYRDMTALAADLRAYLEQRVVSAHATGSWAETKKWVQRNRPLAAALAGLVLVLAAGLVTSALYARRAEAASLELAAKNLTLTTTNTALLARERESRLRGLIEELAYFDTLDDDVYAYARKQTRPAHEWWLEGAELLIEGRAEDPARGLAWSPGLPDVQAELAKVRTRARPAAAAEPQASEPGTFHFDSSQDQWWHQQLEELEAGLRDLGQRIDFARRSVGTPESARLWSEASAAIANSPRYAGLTLTPQVGLLPIGPDPASGLWEFAHLASGEPASRGPQGTLTLRPETGLVFVLLPGGRVPVATDPDQDLELTQLDLDPFFLSKYEISAGQWARIGGLIYREVAAEDALLPAGAMSWDDGRQALAAVGWLRLASEAQWEYGCRAGTTTRYWTGDAVESLEPAAFVDWDGSLPGGSLLPIGQLLANPFGLHDVHGNIYEWCGDDHAWKGGRRPGDGLRTGTGAENRVLRGGAFAFKPEDTNSSFQFPDFPIRRVEFFGLRPARGLTP